MNSSQRSDAGRHAVVAVIVENSRFLVIRRSHLVRAPGLICFPGGGIEPGEDLETAVRRELLEELGIDVMVNKHLWTSETRWGTRLEWLLCARGFGQEPVPNPEEVAAVLWHTEEELSQRGDLLGSMPDFLEHYRVGTFSLD
jgi:8-oxo-dGTP pyrophosphatase MutT (NUDIX family)